MLLQRKSLCDKLPSFHLPRIIQSYNFLKIFLGPADKGDGGSVMYIQSYQIHNVLNVYRRQLSQGKSELSQKAKAPENKSDSVTISAEGRNQSIMEKVTANVLKKITNILPDSDFGQRMIGQMQQEKSEMIRVRKENIFTFNTIDKNNLKETRSIAVDDFKGLMNQLDELAKAAVNRDNSN